MGTTAELFAEMARETERDFRYRNGVLLDTLVSGLARIRVAENKAPLGEKKKYKKQIVVLEEEIERIITSLM